MTAEGACGVARDVVVGDLLFECTGLSQSLGAQLFSFGDKNAACGLYSISIDSRTVTEGALFAALPGSVSDGHAFVEAAFKNGAAAALVERQKIEAFDLVSIAQKYKRTLIAVDNTLRAFQDTARVYLERFPHLVKIGITGSSGKTTTKEITAAILGVEKNTVMNPGNYNSETGLPLSVYAVRPCHEVGVFEVGMNHQGEIAALVSVLKPHIALVTNIGSAHIGILGSQRAIVEEKRKIFSQFNETDIALIPEDSPFREALAEKVNGTVSYFGQKSFAELGGVKSLGLDGTEIIWDGQRVHFALPGRYNLDNAFAAIAIARKVGVSNQTIRQGLESVRPLFGRSEILRGRVTIIQDCYNSNPESAALALEFCDGLDWQGRRVYVMGDMRELGENSPAAHEELGRLLLDSRADMIFLYGNEIEPAAAILRNNALPFMHTCDIQELSHALDMYAQDGDLILLKASRGCALERLSATLLPTVMCNQYEGAA